MYKNRTTKQSSRNILQQLSHYHIKDVYNSKQEKQNIESIEVYNVQSTVRVGDVF